MIRCSKCGKQLPDGAKFCKYCGAVQTQENVDFDDFIPSEASYMRPVVKTSPKAKAQKKTPWQIIVAVVAVVIALVILLSILLVKNRNLKDELADKEKFSVILAEKTDKPVVDFMCKDFDSDGTREAYVVVGESYSPEDDELPEYYDADIYYVNHEEAQMIKDSVSGKVNGLIETDDRLFVSYEIKTDGTAYSYIYTSESNGPAESEISGVYSNVHQDGKKVIATDETGETIEIEITDVIKDIVNGEVVTTENTTKLNEEETTETGTTEVTTREHLTVKPNEQTTSPANTNQDEVSLYKAALSNGGLNNYSSGAASWSGKTVRSCLVDLNDDGIKELYMYMGEGTFSTRYLVFAIQNGKVVKLMEKNDGSGRGYGDVLYLTKRSDTGKPVIVARLGLGGSSMYTSGELVHEIYTYNGSSFTKIMSYGHKIVSLSDPNYSENRSDEYRIAADYASESDYINGLARYGMSDNGPISTYGQMLEGTYSNPVQ